jgi:hypothetical protein
MGDSRLRTLRVGDLARDLLAGRSVRGNEATAVLVPGADDLEAYVAALDAAGADFAAWDGRLGVLDPDGGQNHRLVILDRYGQVYDAVDARDASALPDASALEDWFRFLTTACPECGVLDDPVGRGWVP